MLPPRQLIAFIMTSTGCALFIVLFNSAGVDNPATASTAAEPAAQNITTIVEATTDTPPASSITAMSTAEAIPEAPALVTEDDPSDSFRDWRVASASEIPFPIYPNGTRYRIGGKDGMKLALFETTDDFSTVDAYYGRQASRAGLARKPLSQDYVQYLEPGGADSKAGTTSEPDTQPGIVIHEFIDAREAEQVGAAPQSRTNIIISFR